MTYKEYIGKCPKCSNGEVYQRYGKYGLFLKCEEDCGLSFSNKIGISKNDLIGILNGRDTKIYTIVKQKDNTVTKYNAKYRLDMKSFKLETELINTKET